jgi:hypothetical protein
MKRLNDPSFLLIENTGFTAPDTEHAKKEAVSVIEFKSGC